MNKTGKRVFSRGNEIYSGLGFPILTEKSNALENLIDIMVVFPSIIRVEKSNALENLPGFEHLIWVEKSNALGNVIEIMVVFPSIIPKNS